MTAEILNIAELARLVAEVPFEPGHSPLLSALRCRYPSHEFLTIADHGDISQYSKMIVDAAGKVIAENYETWLTEQYEILGSARAVWDRYEKEFRETGVSIKGSTGQKIIIAIPYGAGPDQWYQLELYAWCDIRARLVFDTWLEPDTLEDLLNPISCPPDGTPTLTPWKYEDPSLVNIRTFMRDLVQIDQERRNSELPQREKETVRVIYADRGPGRPAMEEIPFLQAYPDWLTRPPKELRFLQDWEDSSAGRNGHRLCDHWWLDLGDYTDRDGRRWMSFTPRWADRDGGTNLPAIESGAYRSIYELMAALEDFDSRAGYEMAWYFYMLHGNRLGYAVAERVMEAIEAGRIGLPEHDAAVLKRWSGRHYGF